MCTFELGAAVERGPLARVRSYLERSDGMSFLDMVTVGRMGYYILTPTRLVFHPFSLSLSRRSRTHQARVRLVTELPTNWATRRRRGNRNQNKKRKKKKTNSQMNYISIRFLPGRRRGGKTLKLSGGPSDPRRVLGIALRAECGNEKRQRVPHSDRPRVAV